MAILQNISILNLNKLIVKYIIKSIDLICQAIYPQALYIIQGIV
jgi:hypothetical protein